MFKLEELPKMRAQWQKRREEEYQRESKEICRVYQLDAVRDREQVERLIGAVKELNACTICDGSECKKSVMPYAKPTIDHDEHEGYYIRYGDCAVMARRRLIAKAEKMMPKRYVAKTFADYEPTVDNERAIALGYQFLAEGGKASLYYHGSCGTGKTFLAVLIAKEWLRRGKSMVFGDMPTLLDRIKKTFNDPQASSQQIIDEYANCELLILDDVGTGVISDWAVNVLYQVVNARYNAERPMILTSNYNLEDLQRRLGAKDAVASARIVSRLKQVCKVASLGKHDRRQDR